MKTKDHNQAATDNVKPNRRRKYLINPAVQWKYALTIALTVFMISSIMSSILYGVLHHQARMRLINPTGYTAEVGLTMLLFALAFAAVTAGGVGVWSIMMTHRLCGPLFVLERHFHELVQGRLPKVRPLRRKDEFKEMFSAFSQAIDSLQSQRQAQLTALSQVVTTVRSAAEGDDETRREALTSVVRHMETLRNTILETAEHEQGTSANEAFSVKAKSVAQKEAAMV